MKLLLENWRKYMDDVGDDASRGKEASSLIKVFIGNGVQGLDLAEMMEGHEELALKFQEALQKVKDYIRAINPNAYTATYDTKIEQMESVAEEAMRAVYLTARHFDYDNDEDYSEVMEKFEQWQEAFHDLYYTAPDPETKANADFIKVWAGAE